MKKRHALIIIILVLFILLVSVFVYNTGPRTIVDSIGISNSYLAMFIVALLGGTSTLTSVSYLAVLITFALGGLNPLILGVTAGTGLLISDTIFFFLGREGKKILTGHLKVYSDKFESWVRRQPDWVPPVITYIYTGLTPLPNDVLTIPLGVSGIRYKQIFIALWLGNMTLTTLIAYLAVSGTRFI